MEKVVQQWQNAQESKYGSSQQ
jgi:hypothetical protein